MRPPEYADIIEPTTESDLLNNWIITQELLSKWKTYAGKLEDMINSDY